MYKKMILTATLIASISLVPVFAATSLEQAQQLSIKYVPKESILIKTEEKANEYKIKYYNENEEEKYEIIINKNSGEVEEYKTQLNYIGSNYIKLKKEDIEKIVLTEIPHAQIMSVKLDTDDEFKEYEVHFKTETCNGYMEISPDTGDIIERSFKWNQAQIQDNQNYISLEKVKQIVNEIVPDCIITDIDLEYKNNIYIYDIEAYKNNYEYDLKLNASTGEQISLETEIDDWGDYTWHHSEFDYDFNNSNSSISSKIISLDKVKEIVLQRMPGATIKEIELDEDDGRFTYEGELYKGNSKFEFEINAYTGDIIEWEHEHHR